MLRLLPFVIELALLVYCLIDCIQTDEAAMRNLQKPLWLLLILLLPLIGPIAWLALGRPQRQQGRQAPWPSTRTAGFPEYERPRRNLAPDDDPEFLRQLRASNEEHEKLLRSWEEDLRRREQEQRDRDGKPTKDDD